MSESGKTERIELLELRAISRPLDRPLELPGRLVTASHEFVVIEAKCGGVKGTGYVVLWDKASAVSVFEYCKQLGQYAVNSSPLESEAIHSALVGTLLPVGVFGAAMYALAGIDIAIWDLKARLLGIPMWRLLGGARNSVPVYASGVWYDLDPQEVEEEVAGYSRAGFGAVKMRVDLRDAGRDIERIRAAKAAFDGPVMLEAGLSWERGRVAQVRQDLVGENLFWVEDPFPMEQMGELQMLRDWGIPLAGGEQAYGMDGVKRVLDSAVYDNVILDVYRTGGVTGWLKCAAMAEAYGYRVSSHVVPDISVQLLCGVQNGGWLEWVERSTALFSSAPSVLGGLASPHEGEGFGLDVSEEYAEMHTWRREIVAADTSM